MADINNINCKRTKLSLLESDNLLINQLDDYCLLEIFSYLTIADIKHVEKVCKRWQGLCEVLWKRVRSLKCTCNTWYLVGKDVNSRLYNMTSDNDVRETLKSCGKFIKYFYYSFGYGTILTRVFELCENLEDITIISAGYSAIEIRSMANSYKHLERLTLTGIDGELEKDLSELLCNNKNLKYFSLKEVDVPNNVTGEFLQYLPVDVIDEIDLARSAIMQPHFFVSAMKQFSNLRFFKYAPKGFLTNSMMKVIGEKNTLIKLSISTVSLHSSESFDYLGNLINLKELDLSFNDQLKNAALINISNNCKQLEFFKINGCRSITDEGIASVAKLKQLEIFEMSKLDKVTDEPIANLPNSLKTLKCSSCRKVKDNGVMRLIKKAPNLSHLNLYLCSITNSTIETAIDVTRKRTNGIVLEMCVGRTYTNLNSIPRTLPYLSLNTIQYIYDD